MLETLIATAGGAAAVALPVMSWLMRTEGRLTRLETTVSERLPAPRSHACSHP